MMMATDPKFYFRYRKDRTKMLQEREPTRAEPYYKTLQREREKEKAIEEFKRQETLKVKSRVEGMLPSR